MKQFFLVRKDSSLVSPNLVSTDLAHCNVSVFPKTYKLIWSFFSSPDNHLSQQSASGPEDCLSQGTVKNFRNGFRDWNYVFKTAKNYVFKTAKNTGPWKGCNVHFPVWVGCCWGIVHWLRFASRICNRVRWMTRCSTGPQGPYLDLETSGEQQALDAKGQ